MHSHKRAAFSPNSDYFACFSLDDKLLVWETLKSIFIDCEYDSTVHSTCSSLHWIPRRQTAISPRKSLKKVKLTKSPAENQLLAVGTIKGDVLVYNVFLKNLYLHLAGRHSDAVNDMCFHSETNSFFTCSSDKSIAVWDISNGKQKSKWKAGKGPISSICVIDENNLLSASRTITWWNVLEKRALKEFSGHSTEIFKLLTVNSASLNSCYFLSGAVGDLEIKTWSLNSNEFRAPVASFGFPDQLSDLDISKVSSKDKPLVLSAVTKDGFIHIFEHVLNGNVNQPILPKVSMKVIEKSSSPIVCLKLSTDAESCMLAFGSSKDNITFKHIKIQELFDEKQIKNKLSVNSQDKLPAVLEANKCVSINGIKSPMKRPENNKVKSHLDTVAGCYRRKLRSSSIGLSSNESEIENISHKGELSIHKDKDNLNVTNMKNPKSIVDLLLKGLQTHNQDITEAIFHISDKILIRKCVEILSSSNLKLVLKEINNRLCHKTSYSSVLSKWLKEICFVRLNTIIQSEELTEIAQCTAKHLDSIKIHETVSKMSALNGLLSVTTQISLSEESSSESKDL